MRGRDKNHPTNQNREPNFLTRHFPGEQFSEVWKETESDIYSHINKLNCNKHGIAEMGAKDAGISLRVRFVLVCLCASRRAVPRK